MTERKFIRAERGKYTLEEKEALGKLCKEYKDEYDLKIKETAGKLNYNEKMKKHIKSSPREGCIARAFREFYPDLKNSSIMTLTLNPSSGLEKDLMKM